MLESEDTGRLVIDRCPQTFITADGARVLAVMSLCEEGHLPAAGGVMDQTPWFIGCRAMYRRHERSWAEWRENRDRANGGRKS